MMDAAAVQALVAAAVAEVLAATRTIGTASSATSIHKHYSRIEKLNPEEWKEWHYQFHVATHAFNIKHGALLEIVEQKELDDISTDSLELALNTNEVDWMKKTQADIFSVLSLLTKGEANQIVRSCEDMNGYVAWKKLYDRYNPKTPASLTAAWREVIRPKKLKDMREAGKAIDAWESKVVLLKKEHGEEPTAGLKASLLLEMLPDAVQLTVAQGMNSKRLDYDSLKAKVKLMANVQMDYATPRPMDIGEAEEEHDGEYMEVVGAAKGKGKGPMYGSCWTCGGNHYSRDCPRGKGKGPGKGESEKGKGKGRASAPMFGSCWTCGGAHFSRDCPKGSASSVGGKSSGGKGSGKSKGKGLRCFNCGGVGHRAESCPSAVREVGEEEDWEGGEVESVSEYWNIFGLDECKRSCRWGRRPGKLLGKSQTPPLVTKNRFEALMELDKDDERDFADFNGVLGSKDVTGLNCMHSEYYNMSSNCVTGSDCNIGSKDVIGLVGGLEEVSGSSINPKGSGLSRNPRRSEEAGEVDWILWCADEVERGALAKGEIVVDSGAAESVCPRNWANQFPIKEVPCDRKRNFLNASGGRMEHYGERKVRCGFAGSSTPVSMTFQVSDSRNPLASVARMTENGNIVQFGPKDEDNYVFNPRTDEKIMMRRKGRKFVLDVNFLGANSSFTRQA